MKYVLREDYGTNNKVTVCFFDSMPTTDELIGDAGMTCGEAEDLFYEGKSGVYALEEV